MLLWETSRKKKKKEMQLAFEGRVEQEAPEPDQKVPEERDLEDRVMAVPPTAANTLDPEIHEQQVREGVHDLRGVDGRIVVLHRRGYRVSSFLSFELLAKRTNR